MIRNVESRNILQGLFNKWQGKDKEVINEAKVEDVQTTIIAQPPQLYKLKFYKSSNPDRYYAKFGDYHLCCCYGNERKKVEDDFNKYKLGGYSSFECAKALKSKYNLVKHGTEDYSFVNEGSKTTVLFKYRFDGKLQKICYCKKHYKTREKVLNHCRELVAQGKSLEEIRAIMRPIYTSRKDILSKNNNKHSILKEAPKVPLANYSWNDRGFLLKDGINTKIVPADFNDIESVLINNGSTRSVVSLLPNCDYEALMDLSKYCKTDEYATLRRAGIEIMNNK